MANCNTVTSRRVSGNTADCFCRRFRGSAAPFSGIPPVPNRGWRGGRWLGTASVPAQSTGWRASIHHSCSRGRQELPAGGRLKGADQPRLPSVGHRRIPQALISPAGSTSNASAMLLKTSGEKPLTMPGASTALRRDLLMLPIHSSVGILFFLLTGNIFPDK